MPSETSQPLEFRTEKGAGRATLIAVIFVLALVGWMGSGMIAPAPKTAEDNAPAPTSPVVEAVRVGTLSSEAQPVVEIFLAEGQAIPQRDSQIRSESSGQVLEVLAPKGSDVIAGQVIARIDGTQGEADLAQAQASLDEARRSFTNAETLRDRGVATQDRVEQARSALAAAQARLTAAREAIEDLQIVAPFEGRIEALDIEQGELVSPGQEVGRIVDLEPLTVTIEAPQQSITALEIGLKAEVEFITGQQREGELTFLGTSANPETRTFAAEVTVSNTDKAIPAGLSAQVRIPTGQVEAHFLSPAILSLAPDGTLGVKAVAEDNTVQFYPTQIVRAQTDGVWLSGLPHKAQVITVGQGFVTAGETVEPIPAEVLNAAPDVPRQDQALSAKGAPDQGATQEEEG